MAGTDFLSGDAGLTLEIAGVAYECDASSITLAHEEDDRVPNTFCAPVRTRGVFSISALTSTASGSFWTYLWDNAGEKNIAFTYAPHGNDTPSAAQPHFTGFVDIPHTKPDLGGEAGENTYTFETTLVTSKGTEILKVTS
jgi:hypothetical protein